MARDVFLCAECGVRVYPSKGYSWIGHLISYANGRGVEESTFALCGDHYRSYTKVVQQKEVVRDGSQEG
jgi:hypothetical protein